MLLVEKYFHEIKIFIKSRKCLSKLHILQIDKNMLNRAKCTKHAVHKIIIQFSEILALSFVE